MLSIQNHQQQRLKKVNYKIINSAKKTEFLGENRLEIDEFKSIGSYDNYFNEKGSNLLDNDKYSTKQGLDKNLSKIEKSKSAVYRKDEIDLLNDDKENEEKEKIKVYIFLNYFINLISGQSSIYEQTNQAFM